MKTPSTREMVEDLERRDRLGLLETLLCVWWGPDGVVITAISTNADREGDLILALGGLEVLKGRFVHMLPENAVAEPAPGPKGT